MNSSICPANKLSRTMKYLSHHQNSNVSYAPVKGKNEKQLFSKLVMDLLGEKHQFNSNETITIMSRRWNENALGSNNIMKKIKNILYSITNHGRRQEYVEMQFETLE